MLFHRIRATDVQSGDHLYRWTNLKLFQGIAVQLNEDPSQMYVILLNGLNDFRLVTLSEFQGKGVLRRVLYDQGDSYLHLIKLSGTSYIEQRRPPEEIVQNAFLLLDMAKKNPEGFQKFFPDDFTNFAKLCCTQSHNDWRKHLLENKNNLSSVVNDNNQMKELENKIEILEDKQSCTICMDRSSNIAFYCGHLACSECARTLNQCHICRTDIQGKISLFWC